MDPDLWRSTDGSAGTGETYPLDLQLRFIPRRRTEDRGGELLVLVKRTVGEFRPERGDLGPWGFETRSGRGRRV